MYRDALGRANQRLAARADKVLLMIAGIPVPLGP
jgi:adenosyl cobinamide kinase/adenosyl cobinamide phosphate guanylyltransferase